eukprot:3941053-Rhodomonas_salina.4
MPLCVLSVRTKAMLLRVRCAMSGTDIGGQVASRDVDVTLRAVSVGNAHRTIPGTVSYRTHVIALMTVESRRSWRDVAYGT